MKKIFKVQSQELHQNLCELPVHVTYAVVFYLRYTKREETATKKGISNDCLNIYCVNTNESSIFIPNNTEKHLNTISSHIQNSHLGRHASIMKTQTQTRSVIHMRARNTLLLPLFFMQPPPRA